MKGLHLSIVSCISCNNCNPIRDQKLVSPCLDPAVCGGMDRDIQELRQLAEQARDKAWYLSRLEEGWHGVSKDLGEGAVLEWREGDAGNMVREDGEEDGGGGWRCWRLVATLDAETEVVEKVLLDIDRMQEWNPALSKTKVLFFLLYLG